MIIWTRDRDRWIILPSTSDSIYPRVVLCEVRGRISRWTVIWDDGTHETFKSRDALLRAHPTLTREFLDAWYKLSKETK